MEEGLVFVSMQFRLILRRSGGVFSNLFPVAFADILRHQEELNRLLKGILHRDYYLLTT